MELKNSQNIISGEKELANLNKLFFKAHFLKELPNELNLILVPYFEEFVEKYHQWMENETLRKLVGTEEVMTLAETQEAQKLS
jgi:hypothetical protein